MAPFPLTSARTKYTRAVENCPAARGRARLRVPVRVPREAVPQRVAQRAAGEREAERVVRPHGGDERAQGVAVVGERLGVVAPRQVRPGRAYAAAIRVYADATRGA